MVVTHSRLDTNLTNFEMECLHTRMQNLEPHIPQLSGKDRLQPRQRKSRFCTWLDWLNATIIILFPLCLWNWTISIQILIWMSSIIVTCMKSFVHSYIHGFGFALGLVSASILCLRFIVCLCKALYN